MVSRDENVLGWCICVYCPSILTRPSPLLSFLPAPIVIHCRSGRRAVKAKEILLSKGYKKVLNAGGLHDLKSFHADAKNEEESKKS